MKLATKRWAEHRARDACVRAIGLVMASALSLSACVFHQGYPASWGPRAEGCPNVSGLYLDAGERWGASVPFPFREPTVTTRSLSGLLSGAGEYGKPFKVELIQREGGQLHVRLHVDDHTGSQYRVTYRCTAEAVEVELPPRWVRQSLGIVRASGSLHLTTAAEGDLIGNLDYRTYGMVLFLPIIASGNAWYRFKRAAQDSEAPFPPS